VPNPQIPPACRRLKALIDRHLDEELDPSARAFVEEHLGECRACLSRSEFQIAWRQMVSESLAEAPPPGFSGRMLDAIRREAPE
jgi:anti-sigma factor RsiW